MNTCFVILFPRHLINACRHYSRCMQISESEFFFSTQNCLCFSFLFLSERVPAHLFMEHYFPLLITELYVNMICDWGLPLSLSTRTEEGQFVRQFNYQRYHCSVKGKSSYLIDVSNLLQNLKQPQQRFGPESLKKCLLLSIKSWVIKVGKLQQS